MAWYSRSCCSSYELATTKPAQRRHAWLTQSADVRSWNGVRFSTRVEEWKKRGRCSRAHGGLGDQRRELRVLAARGASHGAPAERADEGAVAAEAAPHPHPPPDLPQHP